MGLWEFMDGWNITLEDILGFTGFAGHIYIITKLFLKEKIFSICLLFEKCIKNKVLENIQIQNLRNMWTIHNRKYFWSNDSNGCIFNRLFKCFDSYFKNECWNWCIVEKSKRALEMYVQSLKLRSWKPVNISYLIHVTRNNLFEFWISVPSL